MIFKLWSYYLVSFENINESTNGLFINETLYKKAIQTDCHFSKHCSINGRFWANVAIGLPSPLAHYSARPMRFTINVITQKGLYQNKVNFSLVSTYNCKMDYCSESAKSKRGKRQIESRQLQKYEEQCMEICSNKIGNFSLLPR